MKYKSVREADYIRLTDLAKLRAASVIIHSVMEQSLPERDQILQLLFVATHELEAPELGR